MQTHFDDAVTRPLDAETLFALIPELSTPTPTRHRINRTTWEPTIDDDDDDDDDDDGATVAFTPAAAPNTASPKPDDCEQTRIDREAAFLDEHARAEFAAGRYSEARAFTERAMSIRRVYYGETDPLLPDSFCALGVLSLRLNRIDEATWHFEQALEVLEHRGCRAGLDVASLYNNLGASARRRGDLLSAQNHYNSALSIKVELLGWHHKSVALTLTNLGRLAEQLGDLESAAAHFAQARQIAEVTEGAVGPALAASLLGIGRVLLRRSDDVAARFAFERALRIREAIHCSPRQLASARFLWAIASELSAPDEARAVVVLAIQDYQRANTLQPENLEAMCTWLAEHDARMTHNRPYHEPLH